jgi:glycosyltransferase involved in cell wall biosynthesis
VSIKISIIIPVFNREKYIARCIRSLLNQSIERKNYELIVINDGSNDKTQQILDFFKDAFKEEIKIIVNEKNVGLPASLNLGIKASKGKYIVRVDSDDYVNKHFLSTLYLMITLNPSYSAIACDYYLVNNEEKILEQVNCEEKPIGCGIIFEANDIKSIGFYDESYLINEEKEFRERYEKKYSIKRLAIPLYRYRRHNHNMTSQNETK